jgi:hypothetical protein
MEMKVEVLVIMEKVEWVEVNMEAVTAMEGSVVLLLITAIMVKVEEVIQAITVRMVDREVTTEAVD